MNKYHLLTHSYCSYITPCVKVNTNECVPIQKPLGSPADDTVAQKFQCTELNLRTGHLNPWRRVHFIVSKCRELIIHWLSVKFQNESDPFGKQYNTDNEQQLQATNIRYNFCILFIQKQWRTKREGRLGGSRPPLPQIPKALQNRAKLNPIVKTVKKFAEFRMPTPPRCSEKRQ